MKNKKFDVERVISLHNQGRYAVDIAKEVGCDYVTVKNYLKELGLKPNKKSKIITDEMKSEMIKLNKEGLTNNQIAEKLGCSSPIVRKHLAENNIEFNSERTKKIIDKELVLSQEQLEILYGTLLGDASIGINCKNARISFTHGRGQEEYFDHKCYLFKEILGKVCKEPRFDKRLNKLIERYSVRTLAHPVFTKLYKKLYKTGVKKVTQSWLDKLTERSLAYWFMDDGSNNGLLCTHCFSLEENKLMQKWFLKKWNIKTTLQHQDGCVCLYILKESKSTFYNLVNPYIIESMSYKLKGWNP